MTQKCKQCGSPFQITNDDLAFYDKISPIFAGKKELIPPPTLCPECRSRRRIMWRNERSLYLRECESCKKEKVSAFRPDEPCHTYCRDCFYEDHWDAMTYGRAADTSKSFLENVRDLFYRTPLMMLYQPGQNENCDYVNFAGIESRNCYFIFNSGRDEDCYYARGLVESKDCADMLIGNGDQFCYECINCSDSYHLLFSQNAAQCTESAFLFNCRRCKHCLGCTNLVEKEYHIFNQPCTPEEFKAVMAKCSSAAFVEESKEKLRQMKLACIHRATNNINADGCTGDFITSSKNCLECYEVKGAEDCKWLTCSRLCKDSRDTFGFAYDSELLYECTAVGLSMRTAFSFTSDTASNAYLCFYCTNVKDCFGCVSLRHKQYCILNKQYTKDEYERLVPQIIALMRADGTWGEFPDPSMSPFCYNETVAQEFMPLEKSEVEARGWRWNDYQQPSPQVQKSIPASELPDSIDDISDDIVHWAIICEATGKPFRLIKQELDFYRTMRVPVPRIQSDERHRQRMLLRNPCKLWERQCAKCHNEMKTTYAPDRPEIVYCEECYADEVY